MTNAGAMERLLEAARKRPMSPSEREDQRRSFAYGNAHIENDRVTRDMVANAAERLKRT